MRAGATSLHALVIRAYRRVKNLYRRHLGHRALRRWNARRDEIIADGRRRQRSGAGDLHLSDAQQMAVHESIARDGIAIVASIDQDGYWASSVGTISGVPQIPNGEFMPRRKFDVDVVQTRDYVGVRKHYRGNVIAFLNELTALDRLGRMGMRVPAILDLDFEGPALTMSYVPGRVLREDLAQAGARVRNRDRVAGETSHESWQRALAAGVEALPQVISRDLIARLAADLRRIHDAGVMVFDIKWGNVIIGSDGEPWWLDFHLAEDHSELPRKSFAVLGDLDFEKFNRSFGTAFPTPTRPRSANAA